MSRTGDSSEIVRQPAPAELTVSTSHGQTQGKRISELLLGEELTEVVPGYRSRISQLEMALEVERAIDTKSHLIVEAGAGSGKTLAYLLPILLSGGRTLIVTSTHTLQKQVQDMVSTLTKVLPHRTVVTMKGRRNYVCPRRLLNPELEGEVSVQTMLRLRQLQAWWPRSKTGDLTEFMDVDVDDVLQEIVTCPASACTGQACPVIDRCPLSRMREQVLKSDIVIGNHHLLASILHSDPLSVLSGFDHIVVDEAHGFPGVVAGSETLSLSSNQLRHLIATAVNAQRRTEVPGNRLLETAATLEHAVVAAADDPSLPTLTLLAERLHHFQVSVDQAAQQDFSFRDLSDRVHTLTGTLDRLLPQMKTGGVCRDEARQTGFRICGLPDTVSGLIQKMMSDSGATWVFTSATLAVNGVCHQFQDATGTRDTRTVLLPSEYDYPNQAALWIPNLPQPSESSHIPELIHAVLPLLGFAPTLMLFCSKRALDEAAALLSGFDGLLVQGRMNRNGLVEAFSSMDRPVLLATQSFREGMELDGDRLRLLVMDKLPFPNIADLNVQIRMNAIAQSARDSFRDYILPEAVIALRQSFGRLIRREHQRGLFVLGDPRVRTHDYGPQFLHSLPSMPVLSSGDDANAYFQGIVHESAGA